MIKYEKAFCCGTVLDKAGVCECETLFISEAKKCPECGCNTYSYNDPANDSTISEYCTNSECEYTENQYIDWEDIKKFSHK